VIGLVVKPTDEISLYANRIESLAQGPTAPNTAINVGQVFPPFTSTQYEVGGKLDLGNFGGSLAFFETTKPSGVTDLNTNVFGVDGDQRNRGIELTLFGEPLDGVRLLGGVTLTDAELQKTAGGTNDGNKASGAPAYQANFGAEWDLPFLSRATVSARVLHTASQYLNVENTLKAPSWTRFDIGGRLTRTISEKDVTFLLNVENIANTAYWASAQGGYLTQGNPLAAKFSISMDF
jgi:iron complex outermembrane receptor protein